MPAVALPVLAADRLLRLTPTDVTRFVRQEQCERFLRFRMAERTGHKFMAESDVIPQRMTPLLSRSGNEFEERADAELRRHGRVIDYALAAGKSHKRPANNDAVANEARDLIPGQSVVLLQARLESELGNWLIRGDVDLIRLNRDAAGALTIVIADLKATAEAKVEHRLQVAFYQLMLEAILKRAGVAHSPIETGVLFRPPVDPTPEELADAEPLLAAAKAAFGFDNVLYEVVADPDAYVRSAHDLVLADDSTARRIAATPFDDLPYSLTFKCDGCLYAEFCLKWSVEHDDLSLLPYMTGTDKSALRRTGVATIKHLAGLKDFAPAPPGEKSKELVAASGHGPMVQALAALGPSGPGSTS